MLYGAPATRRRDAQRNRAAILEAASEVLTGSGEIALMPEIARRAGVGQATLYRHFADRHTLLAGVIAYQLERLEAAAEQTDFRRLLSETLHSLTAHPGLVRLAGRLDPAMQVRYLRRLVAAFAVPLCRARERGEVRPDLELEDLGLLFAMVQGAVEKNGDPGRSIAIILDGVFRD
ncbi:TetR/AcrR family transcriptional regulator [Actinoplanes sp. DH11]|uniref:TetR/AcrR family transcriptional regulator n=1 Tax=Actinoplanes sp. DH11 TaxID=2857011 RepID=UPI001E5B4F03|nr:helix-turn-helix domain-containing protein [Actinoplanes sp. DH11]